jgi:hypothetical protein
VKVIARIISAMARGRSPGMFERAFVTPGAMPEWGWPSAVSGVVICMAVGCTPRDPAAMASPVAPLLFEEGLS